MDPLLVAHRRHHPQADAAPLVRAYTVADRLHAGQMRKSGDPYISHPLAVATILAELGADTACLVAALLHDTVEDTDYTLGQLRAEFGGEIAVLVDGVTELDGAKGGERAAAETFRKMGTVHQTWRPVPGRFTEHIAVPKYNLYRALHTTVIGPDEQLLDVFIRTAEQHRVAEHGLIAHISAAADGDDRRAVARRTDLEWLRRLLAWQSPAGSAEFLDNLRIGIPGPTGRRRRARLLVRTGHAADAAATSPSRTPGRWCRGTRGGL